MASPIIILILLVVPFICAFPKCGSNHKSFVVDGSKCKEYYVCNKEQLRKEMCPNGQLFDNDSGRCDWEELIQTCQASISSLCEKPDGLFVKRGSYCQTYLDCKNGVAIEILCPSGELFDERSGKCDWKEIVECYDRDFFCPASDGTFALKETNCKSYVVCKKGKANIFVCPEDRLFNSEGGYCDWFELVECNDKTTTTSEKETKETSFWSTSNVYNVTVTSSQQVSRTSPDEITKVTSIVTKSTPEQMTKSSELIKTPSDQVTTPISTSFPKISTISHFISTIPERVSTPTKTSHPKVSTTPRSISSTVPERVTTPIKTSHPKISTTPRSTVPEDTTPIKTSDHKMSTTPHSISSTVPGQVTTPSETQTTPLPLSSTVPERNTTPLKTLHPKITTTPHSISTIISERDTTPVKTLHPKLSTTPRSISTTVSEDTTPIKTSYLKISTTSHLISSTVSEQVTTSNKTSYPKITTTPEEIKTAFSTTIKDIITSPENSISENITTSQISSKTITNPVTTAKTTTTQTQSDTSPSAPYYTTPRGCTFGDESCQPDEVLCPGEFGEFPHPDTPFYFVHCDHWRPYIKKCPDGLHFDPKLKVCAWPK